MAPLFYFFGFAGGLVGYLLGLGLFGVFCGGGDTLVKLVLLLDYKIKS